jgi:protein gp37
MPVGADTNIQWCHHTWSPWRGCTKVSEGCRNCYAEKLSHRNPAVLGEWGPEGTRVVSADWKKPETWDRAAARAGTRLRVFPSLCDLFERFDGQITAKGRPLMRSYFQEVLHPKNDEPWGLDDVRFMFFALVRRTPNLDWLVLTKRPQNIKEMARDYLEAWEGDFSTVLPNLWLGTSVEDQVTADARIPHLLEIPVAVRFVSAEPLLGPVDFDDIDDGETFWTRPAIRCENRIDWLIVGGESGPQARPFNIEWARDLVAQCELADVPCFVKQLGSNPIRFDGQPDDLVRRIELRDPKGGDPEEWPEDLRVREFPQRAGVL